MSLPSSRIRPWRTGSMPNSVFSAVDLPAPLGPISSVTLPRLTCRLRWFRITSSPYPATTSSSSMQIGSLLSVPEVGIQHVLVGPDLGGRSDRHRAALDHHHDAMT